MADTINAQTIDRASNPQAVVGSAQSQWFRRPPDQKYASLQTLFAAVDDMRRRSMEWSVDTDDFRFTFSPNEKDVFVQANVGLIRKKTTITADPTHYAFGQLCSTFNAPAGYFREQLKDRPDLIIQALNHGVASREREGVKLLVVDRKVVGKPTGVTSPVPRLAAVTSPTYGRIWDADVAQAAMRIVDASNGRFYSPLDWSKAKRALFASDRDIFMFFIDGGSIVDGGGDRDQLHRGFFIWNSQVGSKTFGIATFLFREVCGNFGIWGAEDVRVLKIRHTSGGPERFVTEAIPALEAYTTASARPLEAAIRRAKAYELPTQEDAFLDWFKARGFNPNETKRAIEFADAEEGSHHTLWDMYNGFTVIARQMAYVEAAVSMERRAGQLMTLVDA